MNLVGHVIKSFEARRASQKVWSRSNNLHIVVNFLTLLGRSTIIVTSRKKFIQNWTFEIAILLSINLLANVNIQNWSFEIAILLSINLFANVNKVRMYGRWLRYCDVTMAHMPMHALSHKNLFSIRFIDFFI